MTLPPAKLVREAVLLDVLAPAAAAAVAFAAILAVFGRRAAGPAAVVALAAGWAAGNALTGVAEWVPGTSRIEWVPWLALAAAVAGLLTRVPRLPAGVGWAVWAAVIAFAAVKLVRASDPTSPWWTVPAFVLLNAAVGFGLAALSRRDPGAGVPAVAALALVTAGSVLIHAHTARLMEAATIAGAALSGIAAVALATKADAGAALPAAAVFLTGVLVIGHHETYSEVPVKSFVLPAVAPLAAAAALVPPLTRLTGARLRLLQFTLLLIPLAAAVWLAEAAEPMDFDNL